MNERGVTPLTATVILIMLSAVLGAGVMAYGKSFIEDRAEFVKGTQIAPKCSEIDIKVIQVGGDPQVCLDPASNTVRLFVESTGGVERAQLRVTGSSDIFTSDALLSSPLGKGEARKIEATYNSVGDVRQVRVTPFVTVSGRKEFCASVTFDAPLKLC